MRLIVHAGFHKTGTTSVQKMMQRNGRKLAQEFRVFTRRHIPAVCEAARAYSVAQDAADLGLFTYELARLFEDQPAEDPRPIVISSEDLSGHMPGRFDLTGYDAAPRLMATVLEVARECLGDVQAQFYFSTRDAAPWVRSCHGQHLRAIRITEGRADYVARMMPYADLSAEVARIAAALDAPVHSTPLEQMQGDPMGPFAPLLDLMAPSAGLRARLTPLPPANPSFPDDVLDQMLALNRSDMGRDDLVAAKKALMEAWRSTQGGAP